MRTINLLILYKLDKKHSIIFTIYEKYFYLFIKLTLNNIKYFFIFSIIYIYIFFLNLYYIRIFFIYLIVLLFF